MASGSIVALLIIIIMMVPMVLIALIFFTQRKAILPGQATVVYGRRLPGGGPAHQVLVGAEGSVQWRFVIPIIESYQVLPFVSREFAYEFRKALVGARTGPERMNISLRAMVRVINQGNGLNTAVEHFLGKTEERIIEVMKKVTEAHMRQGLAKMEPDMVLNDREGTAVTIIQMGNRHLMNVGLELVGLKITEVVA